MKIGYFIYQFAPHCDKPTKLFKKHINHKNFSEHIKYIPQEKATTDYLCLARINWASVKNGRPIGAAGNTCKFRQ